MREAVDGERALGSQDRGLLGGFAAAILRKLHADPRALGKKRQWAMAALTSYRLKDREEREEVGLRLSPHLPPAPRPKIGGAPLDTPVSTLPGVGDKTAERLDSLGLHTLGDLLDHLPRAYIDRRDMRTISDLRTGQEATILATVRNTKVDRIRGNRTRITVTISDGTGYLDCVWWNQEWRSRTLTEGTEAAFSGKVKAFRGKPQMDAPAYDLLRASGEAVHTGRIVPVYPATERLSATQLRRLLHSAFDRLGPIPDPLPAGLRAERNLLGKDVATRLVHFPEDLAHIVDARRRLVFEELFTMQVGLALRKRHVEEDVHGIAHVKDGDKTEAFLESIPFRPTNAQKQAMQEISGDMSTSRPMHRLLQGEVGSGKTLVAVYAAMVAIQSGTQAAIMAPTEVLAEQHARKIRELCEPVGVSVELLTNAVPQARRRDILMRLAAGDLPLLCGTHALISEDVGFHRLGLAIVDEQHRFGLGQRMLLREKGEDPDVLIMTATPIPRTLALTLYGDLDVSILDELPAGRKPVKTMVVGGNTGDRNRAYDIVRAEVAEGRRAFVVCALVDESTALDAKAAVEEAERLRTEVFPDIKVGLLHGQMRTAEKDETMEKFRRGDVSILIATTVVEVGVDIPEATVMLIENAERFGLSQLHQLRGRIGRGEHGGICILFSDAKTDEARQRLEAIARSNDGFVLAEEDLRIRGEGTIFGTRQAGITDLKVARLIEDFPVVVEAREAAFALVEDDPKLARPEHIFLRAEVGRRFGDSLDWLFHG
ncbi:MAG: ATP-dependent DNA helicase RecG [Actinomycetota bacterium]